MARSTHVVEIHRISEILPHPNADKISMIKIHGYTCAIGKEQFRVGDLVAYIPPDSIVPDLPQYEFLKGSRRIRVKKLRGVISQGLIMPAPDGACEGEDVAERMGIVHYEPPEPSSTGGEASKPPPGYRPVYDVESMYRYSHAFEPGEPVWVTEKIHGSCGRFCFANGEIHCGSRTEWKREDARSIWWKALSETPGLRTFCESNDVTVYGEVYGCQDLRYGIEPKGRVAFLAFDILRGDEWLPPAEAYDMFASFGVPHVPILSRGIPFDFSSLVSMSDGPSVVAGAKHLREGIVVRPLIERTHIEFGRVALKLVSNSYLERS